jgi:hypothetical protein
MLELWPKDLGLQFPKWLEIREKMIKELKRKLPKEEL